MKKRVLVILTLLIAFNINAQQDPQYTQYMYNTVAINPAYAGNRGVTSIVGLHRSQWVGLEGAPRTQSLSIHSPIGEGKVGLGLSIASDIIRSHGGNIKLSKSNMGGLGVKIFLPV